MCNNTASQGKIMFIPFASHDVNLVKEMGGAEGKVVAICFVVTPASSNN